VLPGATCLCRLGAPQRTGSCPERSSGAWRAACGVRQEVACAISSLQEQKIEGVIHQRRALLTDLVSLQKLERRPALRIQGGDLAIDDKVLRGQQFQGVEQFRVVEGLLIARNEARFFAVLEKPVLGSRRILSRKASGRLGDPRP
jgi:hypothetical protein